MNLHIWFRLSKSKEPKYIFLYVIILFALEKLREILITLAKAKQSFYAYYPKRVVAQHALWKQHLPYITPHYAIKSNPEPILIKTLHSVGVKFDCASRQELALVKKYIPQPISNEIVYANPCKSLIDLDYAKKLGSPLTVVDSFEELDKLADVKYEGSTLIRIAVDDTHSKMPFSGKFGLPPSQVKDLGDYAESKKIKVKGISFHVGSGGNDGKVYYKSISTAQQLCKTLGKDAKIIDIGGGFLSCEKDFEAKSKFIKATYDPAFQYIAEPGRFFSHTCQDFFVKVIGKKPWSGGWRYTIDDSLYGQFSCIPFDHAKPLWVRVAHVHEENRRKTKGILMGRTCDSVDVIARCEHMEELEVGDWLWFPHMGSYTNATANEFNGFPKPPLLSTYIDAPSIHDICFIDHISENIETVSALSSARLLKN